MRIPQLTAARCKFDGLLQQVAERSEDQSNVSEQIENVEPKTERGSGNSNQKGHGNSSHKAPPKPVKKMETTTNTVITKVKRHLIEFNKLYIYMAKRKNEAFS